MPWGSFAVSCCSYLDCYHARRRFGNASANGASTSNLAVSCRTHQLREFWREWPIFRSCSSLRWWESQRWPCLWPWGIARWDSQTWTSFLKAVKQTSFCNIFSLSMDIYIYIYTVYIQIFIFIYILYQLQLTFMSGCQNIPRGLCAGVGPFTLFAPSNDAFRLLGPGIAATLLLDLNTSMLRFGIKNGQSRASGKRCFSKWATSQLNLEFAEDQSREHSLPHAGWQNFTINGWIGPSLEPQVLQYHVCYGDTPSQQLLPGQDCKYFFHLGCTQLHIRWIFVGDSWFALLGEELSTFQARFEMTWSRDLFPWSHCCPCAGRHAICDIHHTIPSETWPYLFPAMVKGLEAPVVRIGPSCESWIGWCEGLTWPLRNDIPISRQDIPATNGLVHTIGKVSWQRLNCRFKVSGQRFQGDDTAQLCPPTSYFESGALDAVWYSVTALIWKATCSASRSSSSKANRTSRLWQRSSVKYLSSSQIFCSVVYALGTAWYLNPLCILCRPSGSRVWTKPL